MRRLLVALALIARCRTRSPAISTCRPCADRSQSRRSARAADRSVVSRWAGFYAGGQVGMSIASMDFAGATESLMAHDLRELALENDHHPSRWQVLGRGDTRSVAIGGFVGYNNPWEGMIIGVDFNYSRSNSFDRCSGLADHPRRRAVERPALRDHDQRRRLDAHSSTTACCACAPASISATSCRMRVSAPRSAAPISPAPRPSSGLEIDPSGNTPPDALLVHRDRNQDRRTDLRLVAGGGVDVLMMPNVFVRAEYEFVSFGRSTVSRPASTPHAWASASSSDSPRVRPRSRASAAFRASQRA